MPQSRNIAIRHRGNAP